MNQIVIAALIAAGGAVIGAVLQAILSRPDLSPWHPWSKGGQKLVGKWDSAWADGLEGPLRYHETLEITHQRGARLFGKVLRAEEPDKEWKVEGLYNGQFLQLLYSPSPSSKDKDFMDYGCYFFRRTAAGNFIGYSAGFGPSLEGIDDSMSADRHELRHRT